VPLITCTASHFRKRGPRGPLPLAFSWAELIWAAVTVGKWRDDLFANGRYSDYEAVSRIALHWAYLRTDAADRLVRTDAYNELDPTEKAAVSYAIGMSTTKLFGAIELGVPWLMHVDRYRTTFGLRLRPGRSRPDLVGPRDPDTQLDWIVAEAKGRTHGLTRGDVGLLRRQGGRSAFGHASRACRRVGSRFPRR
jgi:hypothetical protein